MNLRDLFRLGASGAPAAPDNMAGGRSRRGPDATPSQTPAASDHTPVPLIIPSPVGAQVPDEPLTRRERKELSEFSRYYTPQVDPSALDDFQARFLRPPFGSVEGGPRPGMPNQIRTEVISFGEGFLRALVARSKDLLTQAEVDAYAKSADDVFRCMRQLEKCSRQAARDYYRQQLRDYGRAVADGSSDERSGDLYKEAELLEEFAQRQTAIREARRQVALPGMAIRRAVSGRIQSVARQIAVELDASERLAAEAWGVELVPSGQLRVAVMFGLNPPVSAVGASGLPNRSDGIFLLAEMMGLKVPPRSADDVSVTQS